MLIKRFQRIFKHKRFLSHLCYLHFTSFAQQAKITACSKTRGKCEGTVSGILVYSDLVGNLGYGESLNEREIANSKEKQITTVIMQMNCGFL